MDDSAGQVLTRSCENDLLYAVATVLILDDDLGSAMWLGRVLNEAGFQALPASRSEEALMIVCDEHFPPIDLVIANLTVEGSRKLVDRLVALNRGLKVIGIGGSSAGVDARVQRPRGKTAPQGARYVKTISRVLSG
jgi:DNA-binding NtrC family response regulator